MEQEKKQERQGGFTLIELLVAIVVVGILTAVAIVGIGGLTNKGASGACKATRDAAQTASAVYYANNNTYAANANQLVTDGALDASNVTINGTGSTISSGTNWSITVGGGGASPTTFSVCA